MPPGTATQGLTPPLSQSAIKACDPCDLCLSPLVLEGLGAACPALGSWKERKLPGAYLKVWASRGFPHVLHFLITH